MSEQEEIQKEMKISGPNIEITDTQKNGKNIQKVPKKRKTIYWGIQLNKNIILDNSHVKESLQKNPLLIPLNSMHSTLLFVGGKDNENESIFFQHINKKCILTIESHGISDSALALRVSKMEFVDDPNPIPSFAKIQHITVALDKNTKAVDSIKSFDEGTIVIHSEPLILEGSFKRY